MHAKNHQGDLLARMTDGIAALTDSEHWRRHLDCQSLFHQYSFGNVVLISAQRPDARRVAGFRTWKKVGRSVRKGEKAIWIVAPMERQGGNERESDEEPVIRGFRYVPVFDIAQTDGDELPAVCHRLSGDDPSASFSGLVRVARSIGYTVASERLPDGTNGDCAFGLRRIRVEDRNSPAQRVKTLAHEIAHALLHEGQHDRALAELEAESTAYVVCQSLGLDTGAYSFGYVAVWAGGGDAAITGIRSSCASIQRAASFILEALGGEPGEGEPAAA
ncbi:MAG: ArdC-like ssDNA-binding domain-containing protein [Acidimicrobiales bacterium]